MLLFTDNVLLRPETLNQREQDTINNSWIKQTCFVNSINRFIENIHWTWTLLNVAQWTRVDANFSLNLLQKTLNSAEVIWTTFIILLWCLLSFKSTVIAQKFFLYISLFHTCLEHQGEFWVNYPFKKSFNKQEEAKAGVKQFDEMMCSLIQLHYFYQTLIQPSGWVGEGKCWLQTWSYAVISVWKMGLMSHFNCAHYQPERICSPTLPFQKTPQKRKRLH